MTLGVEFRGTLYVETRKSLKIIAFYQCQNNEACRRFEGSRNICGVVKIIIKLKGF